MARSRLSTKTSWSSTWYPMSFPPALRGHRASFCRWQLAPLWLSRRTASGEWGRGPGTAPRECPRGGREGEGRKLWDPGATSLCWPAGLWDRCLDACAPSRGAPQFPAARSGPLNILCPGDGGSVCFSKVSSSRWRTGLAFCTPASRTGPGPERVQEYVEGQQLPFP